MAEWNKTRIMLHRLDRDGKTEYKDNVPTYNGKPIITRNSPIDGAVCMGEGRREAIVVDSGYFEVDRLYDIAKRKEEEQEIGMIRAVYDTVRENMKYDEKAVDDIVREFDAENDGEIPLDVFIERGVGICRHMALACGVMMEKFYREMSNDEIDVHINRNYDKHPKIGEGGHTWCRIETPVQPFIIDVAGAFCGTLEDAKAQGMWDYDKPVKA